MEKQISVSVRGLVEFVLRAGDIDHRFAGPDRMLEGSRAHRRLQKAAGTAYNAEVTLSYTIEYRGFTFTLDGRADGVIEGPEGVVVDEIKSTTVPLEEIGENFNPVHWAQAECYAFMLARQRGLSGVGVQLTYCEPEDDGVRRFRRDFTQEELTAFFYDLLDRYIVWAEYESERVGRRDEAIRALQFPFAQYRAGQRAFAAAVYRAVAGCRLLFAQAPTGIGKTMSTLFPAVKAIGEGQAQKIFYLTAKTVTRQVAQDALSRMSYAGLSESGRTASGLGTDFKAVTLTAKDKICPHPGTPCNPEHCERAKGYYDRVNDVLFTMLHAESLITREVIERYAEEHNLCPFEFGLDTSEWTDCIICDYNYVFDPIVALRRYFQNTGGEYVFLVDEAHNLADRAREMYSATLQKSAFLAVKKALSGKDKKLVKALNALNRHFLELRKRCMEEGSAILSQSGEDTEIYPLLEDFIFTAGRYLAKNPPVGEDSLLDLYFECLRFQKIAGFYDENYITFIRADGSDTSLRLFCLDPSENLKSTLTLGKSATFFSATLSPLNYFRQLLGGGEDSPVLSLPSPFAPENLSLLVADRVSTRYKHRSDSLSSVAELILALVCGRQGNYIAFFPSYRYMEDVYEAFCAHCPEEIKTIRQDAGMTDAQRETFLGRFEPGNGTLVGFCVLGGVFSEGIDLAGERLIGTAVVGVGLPQLNPEQDAIMEHFREKNGMGFEFAYMYPGMNKVLQAAGRVIRSEKDRGVVLLIDDRFTRRDYLALFPRHWGHFKRVGNPEQLSRELSSFWGAEQ